MSKLSLILAVVALTVAPAMADWDENQFAKWVQLPDLSPNGIDIKVDNGYLLADDFQCTSIDKITDVHLWGSWRHDVEGVIQKVHLSIHRDIPAVWDPTQGVYEPSRPGPVVWEKDLVPAAVYDPIVDPGYFKLRPYATVSPQFEWWWTPGEYPIPDGDQIVWQLNAFIDEEDALEQEGTAAFPVVYWLDVTVDVEDMGGTQAEFGWKTSIDHWNDDAVIQLAAGGWAELRYPIGHPYYVPFDIQNPSRGSIDMAFVITPEPGTLTILAMGAALALLKRRKR